MEFIKDILSFFNKKDAKILKGYTCQAPNVTADGRTYGKCLRWVSAGKECRYHNKITQNSP